MGKRKLPCTAHFKIDLKYNKEIFEQQYNVILDSVSANAYRHFCKHDLLLQDKKKAFCMNFDAGNMLVKMRYFPKEKDNYTLNIFVSTKRERDLDSIKNSIEKKILNE